MKKRYIIALALTGLLLIPTHHAWLGGKNDSYFDLMILLIILILGYFFSLKLTSYLADFKELKNQSRIEIIFLVVFFILLFIPMSHINMGAISKSENRPLALYRPLIIEKQLNYEYGKNFNEFFNDRFNFRTCLINLHYFFKNINSKDSFIQKRNGWIDMKTHFLYYNDDFKKYASSVIYDKFKYFENLQKYCNEKGIRLYFLITPPKSDIYIPNNKYFRFEEPLSQSMLNFINSKDNQYNIIVPLSALKNASKEHLIFFKTDHHWTDDGAYIGYLEVLKLIKEDYSDIVPLGPNDFNYFFDKRVRTDFGRNFTYGSKNGTGLSDKETENYLDVNYRYYKYKDFDSVTKNFNEELEEKTFYYPKAKNKYRVLMLGTSFNENLTEFIPYTFQNVKLIRTNDIYRGPFRKINYGRIFAYKPDIIIFTLTYDNIKCLEDMFK